MFLIFIPTGATALPQPPHYSEHDVFEQCDFAHLLQLQIYLK